MLDSCLQPVNVFSCHQDEIQTPNYGVLTPTPACVSELLWLSSPIPFPCPPNAVPVHVHASSTSQTSLFSVPTFAWATLSAWNTLAPASHPFFRLSSALIPLEPFLTVPCQVVLLASSWLCSSCITLYVCVRAPIPYLLLVFSHSNGNYAGGNRAYLIHCCIERAWLSTWHTVGSHQMFAEWINEEA